MNQFNENKKHAARALITKMSQLPIDPQGNKTDVVGISDLLVKLFNLLKSEDVGEVVASAVEDEVLTQEQGGEILGIAVWSGKTNGAELQPTIERWLEEANSQIRVGLALTQEPDPGARPRSQTQAKYLELQRNNLTNVVPA